MKLNRACDIQSKFSDVKLKHHRFFLSFQIKQRNCIFINVGKRALVKEKMLINNIIEWPK